MGSTSNEGKKTDMRICLWNSQQSEAQFEPL